MEGSGSAIRWEIKHVLRSEGETSEACTRGFVPSDKDGGAGWIQDGDGVIGEEHLEVSIAKGANDHQVLTEVRHDVDFYCYGQQLRVR